MISRMMLNLRDPSLIPTPGGTASENQTYSDLTFVVSYHPTELSNRSRFSDYYDGGNLCPHSREGLGHMDAGKHSFYVVVWVSFFLKKGRFFLGSSSHNIELDRFDVWTLATVRLLGCLVHEHYIYIYVAP